MVPPRRVHSAEHHSPRGHPLGIQNQTPELTVLRQLAEPRLLPQPRAVMLDKNNCEEGKKEEQSEAARPSKVTLRVKGLRSCSPRVCTLALLRGCFIQQLCLRPFSSKGRTKGLVSIPGGTAETGVAFGVTTLVDKAQTVLYSLGKTPARPMILSVPGTGHLPRDHHHPVNAQWTQGFGFPS